MLLEKADFGRLMTTVLYVLGLIVIGFIAKLYQVRHDFRSLRRQGLPMPPHSLLFGHIPLVADIVSTLPKGASTNYLGDQIQRRYPELDKAFYLDLWPLAPKMLIITSPEMMHQYSQDRYLPKHHFIGEYVTPIVGKHNLLTMEGPMWKQWRGKFNPGFSGGHIIDSVPSIVDEAVVFRDILRERSRKNEIFQLEELTLNLTIDIIGKVTMDHNFNSQRAHNRMTSALRSQIVWARFGVDPNPLAFLNALRPMVQWYNIRAMRSYLSHQLNLRYSNIQIEDIEERSTVDLALKHHHASELRSTGTTPAVTSPMVDAAFTELVTSQIRIFLFAGHDTTSASAVYVYHLLSKHPSVLALVQEEHNSIFGPDIDALPAILATAPHELNQLPVTLAVIKETLRLFPPAASARAGQKDFLLTSPDINIPFPTENCLVWSDHTALHHSARYWVRPEEFLPERWLVGEDDTLYPMKDAWRPFEKGPRNCIGQELAIAELKIILALTAREFMIVDAYGEWDVKMGTGKREQGGVNGERAYQINRGGGHPSDFYPCRVESLIPA